MRVATLEIDVRAGDVAGNLAAARGALGLAARAGARLAVLPEMWPTSFVPRAGKEEVTATEAAVRDLGQTSRELGVAVMGTAFGPLGAGGVGDEPLPTNRAHILDGGEAVGSYDKVHLFTPTAEHLAFRAGDEAPPVVTLKGESIPIAPLVCYDLRFPEVARSAFRRGAELLCVSAQWPDGRENHWTSLLSGRAAELEGFVVGSNRLGVDLVGRRRMRLEFSGHAGVFGPDGTRRDPVEVVGLDAGEGRAASRISVHDIDIAEARRLRRAVPVLADERRGPMERWLKDAPPAGGRVVPGAD